MHVLGMHRCALVTVVFCLVGCNNSGRSNPGPGHDGGGTPGGSGGAPGDGAIVRDGGTVVIGTPSNPGPWSGTPVTSGTVPTIVYPSDQTRFPRNIYRTLFQWRSAGYSQFRMTFDGPTKVVVYTDGQHALCAGKTPAAGCWEADQPSWAAIAGGNAGEQVTWTVDALDTSTTPPTVRRSSSIQLGFSREDVVGAIFYWSTTSAGIRRANVAAADPEDYITGVPGTTYSNPDDKVKCVACHVVSRDGKYMVAPVAATSGQSLWTMEVTRLAPPKPLVKTIANTAGHGFATISPDDTYVIAAFKGKMWMVDRATGTFIEDLPLGTAKGTHPDWSPDGEHVVFATGEGDAPAGAGLSLMQFAPGTKAWTGPTTLLAPGTGRTDLFPMYSPDGSWIAFSRGVKGGHDELAAQLWLTSSRPGSAQPVELVNANRVVSNQLGNGQHENSQPTWAPPGDLHWVAFNSKREYGVVQGAGRQQIWVAAVDPSKLGTGEDPSYPAFRLQFQGLNEDNHRAYWTLDVRDTPPPDAGVPPRDAGIPDTGICVAAGQICTPGASVCCDPGYYCDSDDNGETYRCTEPPIP